MKNSKRSKTAKRAKSKAGGVTIGLLGFEKISAIEGLHLTRDMKTTFRTLKRSGASPQQRRAALIKKYGTAS
jgi:hypothetical protein